MLGLELRRYRALFQEFGTKQMRVFRQAQQPDKSEHSPKVSIQIKVKTIITLLIISYITYRYLKLDE